MCRVGCASLSAMPAQTPIAMQAKPIARARFGRRASALERRRGSSIRWWVAAVGIQEAATTARPAATESGPQIDGGEDQRRPVPQVPGVGDAPDVADGGEREQARPGPPLPGRRERRRRGSGRRCRGSAAEPRSPGTGCSRRRRRPRRRSPRGRPSRSPPPRARRDAHRPQHRQRRPQGQLPGAAEGREVGGGGLVVGEVDAERERADQDDRQRHPDRRAERAPVASPEPGDRQQQGRPDEVELLLDRQRPEVQHRARFDSWAK